MLLQTPGYARSLAQATAPLAGEVAWDRVTEAVLARLEAILRDRRTETEDGLAAYSEAFDQLRALALSPAQSALLMCGMAGV